MVYIVVHERDMSWLLLLVIRLMTDLLRKYRGSVVIMVGRGGAEPHYVTTNLYIFVVYQS